MLTRKAKYHSQRVRPACWQFPGNYEQNNPFGQFFKNPFFFLKAVWCYSTSVYNSSPSGSEAKN